MANSFKYNEKLDGGNIRLVKVKPRLKNEKQQFLNLQLITGCLPEKDATSKAPSVPYLALSYVWDQVNGKIDYNAELKPVLLNDELFRIKNNLERALAHLEGTIDLPIWIDSICINQNDDDEKEKQIPRMREIYENAKRTIIWLGESDAAAERVMNHLKRIGKDAIGAGINDLSENDFTIWPEFAKSEDQERKIQIRTKLEELIPKMGKGYDDGVPFPLNDLVYISNLPWFTRVWVHQEFAVSKDSTFMYGKWEVPGEQFVAGFFFSQLWIAHELHSLTQVRSLFHFPSALISLWWRNGWSFMYTFVRSLFTPPHQMISLRATRTLNVRQKWQRTDPPTLKTRLCHTFVLESGDHTGASASVPEDRIYALLGIVDPADIQRLGIVVDYKIGTKFVYTDVAARLIEQGHIDILSLCRPANPETPVNPEPRQEEKLPSWVPNWEKPISPPWGGHLEHYLFSASGSEQPPKTPRQTQTSHNFLTIKARPLGTLIEVGKDAWNTGKNEKFDLDKATTLFMKITNLLGNKICDYSKTEQEEAFWRIPIGDKELNNIGITQRATEKSHKEFKDMIALMTRKIDRSKWPDIASYTRSMMDMRNARPFLSTKGHVGLCPAASIEGDMIFIPIGAHVPYVFRRVSDKVSSESFELIGEAYVHGMMNGQILKTEFKIQELKVI